MMMVLKIRSKLILYTACIIFIVGGSISFYAFFQGKKSVLSSFESRCTDMAGLLSKTIYDDLCYLNIPSLNRKLLEARVNTDITFSHVFDLKGAIIADGTDDISLRDQKSVDPFTADILRGERWRVHFSENLLKVGGPIRIGNEDPVGFLMIGFSLTNTNRWVQDLAITSFLVTSICLILGVLLAFLFSRSLSNPIVVLARGAADLSQGNFASRVELNRKDELGTLADSFNQMGQDLMSMMRKEKDLKEEALQAANSEKMRTEQLAQSKAGLEEEVGQRKRIENQLRQALLATKSILEAMPFGVIIVGKDKRIRMLNRASMKLMGVNSSEGILGNICHKTICPADLNKCPIIDLGQKVDSSQRILLGPGGKHIPILKTVRPIHLDGDEVLLEAFVDISQLKETEAELLLARGKAESASRAKSEFLANMSHELRTPLNHILGFTELVANQQCGELNPEQEEYLQDVLQSGQHLLALINDILDLSKVEAGKLALEVTDLNLRPLLENSLHMVKERALAHRIRLATDIDGIPEVVRGDERKMKQILYNLLSNAVKFTPDGGSVRLSARLISDFGIWNSDLKKEAEDPATRIPQPAIQISVEDTGIGIKEEDLGRIFAPFEQVDGSACRRYEGTGLGLSLTKRLVELHGGRIWAESAGEGKGSKFALIIPVEPRVPIAEGKRMGDGT